MTTPSPCLWSQDAPLPMGTDTRICATSWQTDPLPRDCLLPDLCLWFLAPSLALTLGHRCQEGAWTMRGQDRGSLTWNGHQQAASDPRNVRGGHRHTGCPVPAGRDLGHKLGCPSSHREGPGPPNQVSGPETASGSKTE